MPLSQFAGSSSNQDINILCTSSIPSHFDFLFLLLFTELEKRRPIGRFSLSPAGSWLGFAQPLCFTI